MSQLRFAWLLCALLAFVVIVTGCAEGSISTERVCGDGRVQDGEGCDDENMVSGDGCSETCAVELGYICRPGNPSECSTTCGNDLVDEGEECDGFDLNGESCALRGFELGELACTQECAIDSSACYTVSCDNAVVDEGEDCDDGGAADGDGCSAECLLEPGWVCFGQPSNCGRMCGNGTVDEGEDCDGDALDGADCETEGFIGGDLACGDDCMFITDACIADRCGNAFVGPDEGCDDGNDQGLDGCSVICEVETGWACTGSPSTCTELCGNDVVDDGEVCDGPELADADCVSRGFDTGTLACDDACAFDTSGCRLFSCGNDVLETGEDCDGSDMGPETCLSLGMLGGSVGCTDNCGYDLTPCIAPVCGDGIITQDIGETCDDNGTTSGDGCNAACQIEAGWLCSGEPSTCVESCPNGAIDAGESCDGSELGGEDCASQGFAGGDLACMADCTFDTSGCLVSICDNGTLEPDEECDGSDFGGQDCTSYAFAGGNLTCTGCVIGTGDCTTCAAQGCATDSTPSGERCSQAKVVGRDDAIGGGAFFSGDTYNDGNNDDLSTNDSACWDAKYDNFYRIYLVAGDQLQVTLFPLDTRFNCMLKTYSGIDCDDNGSGDLLFCTNNGSDGTNETFSYTATADGWYSVVVDGRMAFDSDHDWGAYNIQFVLTCGTAGCCCS